MHSNQGLTLDRYLEKKSPLDPAQAARISMQIAQQLGSAGGSLLIHPGRILVTKEGTVQLLPPPTEELSLPAVVEYPAYASPEEIRGAQPDVRSGLYSLGCTLYELLAGEPPYPRIDPKQILHAHLEAPVPDVREKAGAVPDALGEVIRELLEKDPDLRIQTPGELIRRLKQSLGVGGGAAGSPRPVKAAPPPAPRSNTAPTPASRKPEEARAVPRRMAPMPAQTGWTGSGGARPRAGRAGTASRQGTAGKRPLSRHGRASRRPLGTEDDLDAEDQIIEVAPQQRTFYFTLGGAVVGLLLGLMVVHFVQQQNEAVDAGTAIKIEQDRKNQLAERKKVVADRDGENRQNVTQLLAQAKQKPPEVRKDILVNSLNSLCETPYSHPLADELIKVWSAQPPESAAEVATQDQTFQKQKAEAEKLYEEGKLGEAIEKIRENEVDLKNRHGQEIDAFIDKLSKEMDAKWEATKTEVDKLALAGESDGAIKALEEAVKYGTGAIQRDAQRRMEALQQFAAIRADAKGKKTAAEDAEDKADGPMKKNDGGKAKKADSKKAGGESDDESFVDPDEK